MLPQVASGVLDAEAEEAQRGLRDDDGAEGHRGVDYELRHDVGHEVPEYAPGGADACGLLGDHELLLALGEYLTADQTRYTGPAQQAERGHHPDKSHIGVHLERVEEGAHDDEYRVSGYAVEDVDEAHDERVDPAAEEAGQAAEDDADERLQEDDDEAYHQGDAAAVHHAGEDVHAVAVGAEPVLGGGPGVDVDEVGGLVAAEHILAGLALDGYLGVYEHGVALLVVDGAGLLIGLGYGVDEGGLGDAVGLHLGDDVLRGLLEVYGQGVLAGVAAHDEGAKGDYLVPRGVGDAAALAVEADGVGLAVVLELTVAPGGEQGLGLELVGVLHGGVVGVEDERGAHEGVGRLADGAEVIGAAALGNAVALAVVADVGLAVLYGGLDLGGHALVGHKAVDAEQDGALAGDAVLVLDGHLHGVGDAVAGEGLLAGLDGGRGGGLKVGLLGGDGLGLDGLLPVRGGLLLPVRGLGREGLGVGVGEAWCILS